MDESGNIEEKPNLTDLSESTSLRIHQENKKSPDKLCSNTEWDNVTDDVYFLEAIEDAELAEVADNSLTTWNCDLEEIPDELLIEVLRKQEVCGNKTYN